MARRTKKPAKAVVQQPRTSPKYQKLVMKGDKEFDRKVDDAIHEIIKTKNNLF